ncbi:hypothetical protein PHMEG_0002275 [Phytophthora megakarya]|uniref:Uncharacterized protein n=1 Tax=Phytophthora megakarya TaxID=4795 RepID=A0A225WYP3_9STRA|nr:hypothetical protein PHMEG_0002275 [Phytophthora megakarya]
MGSNQQNQLSFAQASLQKKHVVSELKYVNLPWIAPISDDVERLFSQADLVYNDQLRGMLPSNLELLLFICSNHSSLLHAYHKLRVNLGRETTGNPC